MSQPDVLLITVDRRRVLLPLVGSMAFFLLYSLLMIPDKCNLPNCLFGGFFGFCTVFYASMFLPGTRLELNPDRFSVRTTFRRFAHRWEDVERFGLCGLAPVKTVGFILCVRSQRRRPFYLLSWTLTGFDDSIPDVFELRPSELLLLLSDWHSRCHCVASGEKNGDATS
jgi:hypothetical protein